MCSKKEKHICPYCGHDTAYTIGEKFVDVNVHAQYVARGFYIELLECEKCGKRYEPDLEWPREYAEVVKELDWKEVLLEKLDIPDGKIYIILNRPYKLSDVRKIRFSEDGNITVEFKDRSGLITSDLKKYLLVIGNRNEPIYIGELVDYMVLA